jgi:PAS domain S-box-containing protein
MRRRGLIGGTVVALLTLSIVIGCIFASMLWAVSDQRIAAAQARSSEDRVAAVLVHQKLVLDLEVGIRGYQITGKRRFLEPYFDARRALPLNFALIEKRLAGDEAHRRDLLAIERDIDSYITDFAEPVVRDGAGATRANRTAATAEGKRRVDALRLKFKSFVDDEFAQSHRAARHAEVRATHAKRIGAAGLVASLLLVLLYGLYQFRAVLRPVRRVARATEQLGDGDLSVRVPDSGNGEVSALATGFNVMAVSLEYTRDELEAQNSELQTQQAALQVAVDELAEKKRRIERFHAFGARLASEGELQPLAAAILNELAEMVDAEVGELHAVGADDPDSGVKLAVRGLVRDDHAPVRRGEGLAGRAMAECRPVLASHGQTGMTVPAFGDTVAVRHEMHVPLIHAGRVVGVLSLARVDDRPFSSSELELVETLTERAAVGLANSILLQETRRQASITSAVLATAADGFISIDEDGLVLEWNVRSEEMFGWTREEVLGRPLSASIVPHRFRGAHESGIRRFAVTGESHMSGREVELVALHRNGREFPISLTMSPLPLDGRMVINAFVRDISDRKRAEMYVGVQHAVTRVLSEAATLEEARQGVLEAVGAGLGWDFGAVWAADGGELRCLGVWKGGAGSQVAFADATLNARLMRGQGLPGRVWEVNEAVWLEDLEAGLTPERAEAASEAGLRSAVAFPVANDGRFIGLVEFFTEGMRRPDEGLLSLLDTIGSQIGQFSARKRAEAEAERLKDEFFALVSHELRTPLTSIIGYLELVLEEDSVDPETRRFLDVVARNAQRLLRLVGDLLFVAQVEAGNLGLDPGSVDLAATAAESVEAARPRAEEHQIELVLDADRLPETTGDAGRIGQAIDNLVSNAIKFTPHGGRVEVKVRRDGPSGVLEVTDTGVGITDEDQARLFERFFRSSTATDSAIPGVGLGLSIVKAIVEGHGGRMEVDSEPGEGTTFRAILPLAEPQHELPAPRDTTEVSA